MSLFKKLFTLIALLSVVIFANPTGYSYIDSAINFPWAVDTQSGFMALAGCLLVCTILFFFYSSWRTTEFIGKFIFVMILVASTFIAFTLGAFNNSLSASWYVIAVVYFFFLWGMFYPRLKYSLFKTRSVDDVDDNNNSNDE